MEPVISIPIPFEDSRKEFKVDYIDGYPDSEYWANPYLRFEHGSFARSRPRPNSQNIFQPMYLRSAGTFTDERFCTSCQHPRRVTVIFSRNPRMLVSGLTGQFPVPRAGDQIYRKNKPQHISESWHQRHHSVFGTAETTHG